MAEIKYDVKRGAEIYRAISDPRLKSWILGGKIKRGEVVVWRSGLSGWRKPEELEELAPFFEEWEKEQLRERKPKKRILLQKKKKKKKKKKIKDILIVDDEQYLCELLYDLLNGRKYNVAVANTKREAMSCIKKERPDLIFLDLKLPDGDGMEILSKVKKTSPGTVVSIISAYGSEERREEASKKGAYSFIGKPFSKGEIFESIREIDKGRRRV